MKRIQFFLSLIFICTTMHLSAMKRAHEQITEATDATPLEILPPENITTIAALCDSQSRANLSLTNHYFNALISVKDNSAIISENDFSIEKENRFYYLVYGCIHNIPNLVQKVLSYFGSDEKEKYARDEATYYIQSITNSPASKLLPPYPFQESLEEESDDESEEDESFLQWVIQQKNIPLLKFVLNQPNKTITKELNEALHYAITLANNANLPVKPENNDALVCQQIIRLLLTHPDIKINTINSTAYNHLPNCDWTALTRAAYCNLPEIVQLLLAKSTIEINMQPEPSENTALHYAAEEGCSDVLSILLSDSRTNPNVQNADGNTPLHLIIQSIHTKKLEPLQSILANVRTELNRQNNDGNTPLHIAVKKNSLEKVKLLLADQRTDITITNAEGLTPDAMCKKKIKLNQIKLHLISKSQDAATIEKAKQHLANTESIYDLLELHKLIHYCSSPASATHKTLHDI